MSTVGTKGERSSIEFCSTIREDIYFETWMSSDEPAKSAFRLAGILRLYSAAEPEGSGNVVTNNGKAVGA